MRIKEALTCILAAVGFAAPAGLLALVSAPAHAQKTVAVATGNLNGGFIALKDGKSSKPRAVHIQMRPDPLAK